MTSIKTINHPPTKSKRSLTEQEKKDIADAVELVINESGYGDVLVTVKNEKLDIMEITIKQKF